MRAIAAARTPCVRSGCVRSMRATRSDFLPRLIDSRLFRKAGDRVYLVSMRADSLTAFFQLSVTRAHKDDDLPLVYEPRALHIY